MTYIKKVWLFEADKTGGNTPDTKSNDSSTPPSCSLEAQPIGIDLDLLVQTWLVTSYLEELLDVSWQERVLEMDVVDRDDIPVGTKWFGNELKLMIIHLDFVDQIVSLFLHVAHELLQEYSLVVNPQHFVPELTDLPSLFVTDK